MPRPVTSFSAFRYPLSVSFRCAALPGVATGHLRFEIVPPREALCDLLLEAEGARLVEHRSVETFGEVFLWQVCLRNGVRVLVPFSITQFLHQLRRCIANMHW